VRRSVLVFGGAQNPSKLSTKTFRRGEGVKSKYLTLAIAACYAGEMAGSLGVEFEDAHLPPLRARQRTAARIKPALPLPLIKECQYLALTHFRLMTVSTAEPQPNQNKVRFVTQE
jgi:hypothetical protein